MQRAMKFYLLHGQPLSPDCLACVAFADYEARSPTSRPGPLSTCTLRVVCDRLAAGSSDTNSPVGPLCYDHRVRARALTGR